MPQDPIKRLIAQFSRFTVETNIDYDDWEMAATEYEVKEIQRNIDRFHDSWKWGNADQQENTVEFLTEVAEKNKKTAISIMYRIYTLADTDSDTLEKYPTLEILENEDPKTDILYKSFRTERFLNINDIPGTFYPKLVENINQCYSVGVNDATLVLTRKLLENLLIDILRAQYGKQQINLYYRPQNKRFESFSTLVDNFEKNLDDFQHLSGGLDGDFIDELETFRQNANAEAHSIETSITASEIEEYREQAQHVSKVLFRLNKNV